jgi:molecular chaperone GrpE
MSDENSEEASGAADAPDDEAGEPAADTIADAPGVDDRAIDLDAGARAVAEHAAEADPRLGRAVVALIDRIAGLEGERADLERELDNAETQLKRKQADFENYKKRAKREQERVKEHATEELVERLIDVRDDLARALEDGADADAIREGVRMTLSEFDRMLDEEDVERIEPDPGDSVDPERHEVLARVDSDHDPGAIDELHRPGYRMSDSVLRPAQVTVSGDADD